MAYLWSPGGYERAALTRDLERVRVLTCGVAKPSQADELITARTSDALALMDIRVLDHLIVGGTTVTSLAERGHV